MKVVAVVAFLLAVPVYRAALIPDVLAEMDLTDAALALTTGGMKEDLEAKGPFTMFVPTNSAFKNATMPTSKDDLVQILQYHVIAGNISTKDMVGEQMTLLGEPLDIKENKLENGTTEYVINDLAKITNPDIYADNGILQVIDTVLKPKNMSEANLNTTDISMNATSGNTTERENGTSIEIGLGPELEAAGETETKDG